MISSPRNVYPLVAELEYTVSIMPKYPINANGEKQRTPPAVNELRCEYQEFPLSVDTLKPRFSWVITVFRPVAYQILVASSRANLNANNGDMWDI